MVGQHGKRAIIVSAYRVCKQDCDITTNTAMAQQTRLLLQHGNTSPNPRQQFISDLITQVKVWRQQGKEVLIGMDANEDVDSMKSHISCLFAETDLIDIHHHRHLAQPKPATHQCRTSPFDMIIGSDLFAAALTAAWILPFGNPPLIKGDHRLLGANFHPGILFGSSPIHPSVGLICGINSRHKQHVLHFCKQVIKNCNQDHLAEQTATLFSKDTLGETDILELERIDTTLTQILVKANQRCHPLSAVPWSPALQQAYLLHRYWIVTRTTK